MSRRRFLRCSAVALSGLAMRFVQAGDLANGDTDNIVGNFRYIYGNPETRREFYDFLANVFHLYPQQKLHALIAETTNTYGNDQEIYLQLQRVLTEIKPFLATLTYALPALVKQKDVMAKQTSALLPGKHRFDGYLEVGSTGRYLDSLEEVLDINGDIFFLSDRPATYSVEDVLDRGQIGKQGEWIALNDYQTTIDKTIPSNSLDLATVYIGFHHCAPPLREEFIGSIRNTLKPSGYLILRDHDAKNEKMWRLVALAHDVFNMGTEESWSYNDKERRHFYPLAELDKMMNKFGFRSQGKRLLQQGDPTLNSLMLYRKS